MTGPLVPDDTCAAEADSRSEKRTRAPRRPRPPGYTITLHLKVMPESNAWLDKAAIETNQVWNFANATRHAAAHPYRRRESYLSAAALDKLTAGCGELFEKIGSDVAQRVTAELVTRQTQFRRTKLRFRNSFGSRKALGWIPFKAANLRVKGNRLRFMGKTLRLFQMERFLEHRNHAIPPPAPRTKRKTSKVNPVVPPPFAPTMTIGDGCFAQNALGEWFLNVPFWVHYPDGTTVDSDGLVAFPSGTVEIAGYPAIAPNEKIGIDPGLKAVITTSEGEVFDANRSYRALEQKIALCQKRGHKKQAKRLHQKAKNKRNDQIHQISHRLIAQNQMLNLGNVSSAFLRSGSKAKSALDGGWGMLKTQLHVKGRRAGRWVCDIDESYSTQTCSACRSRSGPAGRTGLVVRSWECRACGTTHDRDVNAAINIRDAVITKDSQGRAQKRASVSGNEMR